MFLKKLIATAVLACASVQVSAFYETQLGVTTEVNAVSESNGNVAVQGDLFAVGNPTAGKVLVYKINRTNNTTALVSTLTDTLFNSGLNQAGFGTSVALGQGFIAIGSPTAGKVYVASIADSGTVNTADFATLGPDTGLGAKVVADGQKIVAMSTTAATPYAQVYDYVSSGPVVVTAKCSAQSAVTPAGLAVSGNRGFLGIPGSNKVDVFSLTTASGACAQETEIQPSGSFAGSGFGNLVAAYGNSVIVADTDTTGKLHSVDLTGNVAATISVNETSLIGAGVAVEALAFHRGIFAFSTPDKVFSAAPEGRVYFGTESNGFLVYKGGKAPSSLDTDNLFGFSVAVGDGIIGFLEGRSGGNGGPFNLYTYRTSQNSGIGIVANKSVATVGQQITYTATITADANDPLQNATVTLDLGVTGSAHVAYASNNSNCAVSGLVLTCSGIDVQAGTTKQISAVVDVVSGGNEAYASTSASASLAMKEIDTTSGNNSATTSGITLNVAPVANNASVSANEEVTITSRLIASDNEGGALTFEVLTNPTHGTVQLTDAAGAYTYVPVTNYFGSDSFTFRVTDEHGITSQIKTVSITINTVNDEPVANSDSVTITEDTETDIAVLANDSDIEDGTPTVISATGAAKGTLSTDGTVVTYTPNANATGADGFNYTVQDLGGLTSQGHVSVTLTSVNDSPAITSTAVTSATQGSLYTYVFTATDADTADTVVLSAVTKPAWLSFNASTGLLSGTPSNSDVGAHSVTLRATDGTVNVDQSFTITVANTNDAPSITVGPSVTVLMSEDASPIAFSLTLSATDIDAGTTLTWSVASAPSHGVASVSGTGTSKAIGYVPALNFNGTDTFVVQVSDGTAAYTTTVQVNVSAVGDAPVLGAIGNKSSQENTGLAFVVAGTDVDGDALTYSAVGLPSGMTIGASSGAVVWNPSHAQAGTYPITVTVSDGTFSDSETITVTVANSDRATQLSWNVVEVNEDTLYSGLISATDADGDMVTFSVVTQPAHGDLTFGADGVFAYRGDAEFSGTDTFVWKYTVNGVDSAGVTMPITVRAVNDAPVADDLTISRAQRLVSVAGAQASGYAITATDVDSDRIIYAIGSSSLPAGIQAGVNSATDGKVWVSTPAEYSGSFSFDAIACDVPRACDTVTVSVTITPATDPSAFAGPQAVVLSSYTETVDLSVENLFAPGYQVIALDPAAHGTVDSTDGIVTYAAPANFAGEDTFIVSAEKDGEVISRAVNVTVGTATAEASGSGGGGGALDWLFLSTGLAFVASRRRG